MKEVWLEVEGGVDVVTRDFGRWLEVGGRVEAGV